MVKKGAKETQNSAMRFSKKHALTIVLVAIAIVSSIAIISYEILKPHPTFFSKRAVIVDQLAVDSPNSTFVNSVTAMLEMDGFNVSYARENATVDFFSRLAEGNYGIIILRTHMAMRQDQNTVDIFTSEEYNDYSHTSEVREGLVVEGVINATAPPTKYFAVTSDFILNMVGNLPKSIIIMMGCWSLRSGYDQVAKAFVSKGATLCTGWSDLVLPGDTDADTAKFISSLIHGGDMNNAVLGDFYIYDTSNGSIKSSMSFYPSTESGLKLADLVNQASNSAAFEVPVKEGFPSLVKTGRICKSSYTSGDYLG